MMAAGAAFDGDSVDSILSWVDEDEIEVSQTYSVDGILTPYHDEDEEKESQVENISAVFDDPEMKEKPVRGLTNMA